MAAAGSVTVAGDSGEGTAAPGICLICDLGLEPWRGHGGRWPQGASADCCGRSVGGSEASGDADGDHRPHGRQGPRQFHGRPWCPSIWKPGPETPGGRRGLTIAQDGPAQAQGVCGPRTHVLYQPMLYFLQHWDREERDSVRGVYSRAVRPSPPQLSSSWPVTAGAEGAALSSGAGVTVRWGEPQWGRAGPSALLALCEGGAGSWKEADV